jgi:hypothetical protein
MIFIASGDNAETTTTETEDVLQQKVPKLL